MCMSDFHCGLDVNDLRELCENSEASTLSIATNVLGKMAEFLVSSGYLFATCPDPNNVKNHILVFGKNAAGSVSAAAQEVMSDRI